MRVAAVFVALLVAAQAATAAPLGECHLDRAGPIGVREDVAERLKVSQLKAELHEEKMRAAGVQPSYPATAAAVPGPDQLKAAFEADTAAWRYACRSPQVVEFDSALTRAASAAESARLADTSQK